MDDLELIFTMLGERVTTEISKGKVAGNARKETQKELGRSVVLENNYLGMTGNRALDE